MTKTAIQQQADSIVDKFRGYVGGHGEMIEDWEGNETINSTHCAIIYCEGILEHIPDKVPDGWFLVKNPEHIKYTEILTELKTRI